MGVIPSRYVATTGTATAAPVVTGATPRRARAVVRHVPMYVPGLKDGLISWVIGSRDRRCNSLENNKISPNIMIQ